MAAKAKTEGVKTVEEVAGEVVEAASATDEREAFLSDAELLKDLPELTPPARLRQKTFNQIHSVLIDLERYGIFKAEGSGYKPVEELDLPDKMLVINDACARIDEFAESIAVDADAYAEWAVKQVGKHDVWLALLVRYVAAGKK